MGRVLVFLVMTVFVSVDSAFVSKHDVRSISMCGQVLSGISRWIDGLRDRLISSRLLTSTRVLNVTASIEEKPRVQPVGLILFDMSFIVKNENVTQEVSDAIMSCVSNASGTNVTRWGLYHAEVQIAGLIQVEYFAFTLVDDAEQFRREVTRYMIGTDLRGCVREKIPNFGIEAAVVSGRKIAESLPNSNRAAGGLKVWIVGVICGVVFAVGLVLGVLAVLRRRTMFDKSLYDPEPAPLVSDVERERREQQVLESELRAIAIDYRN